jgi:acetyl-CoA synthetase
VTKVCGWGFGKGLRPSPNPSPPVHNVAGEICLDLATRPLGLMVGYSDDPARTADVMRDGYYHTGDVAARDADRYITYVGHTGDVFKSSDYRISPFELESILIEHEGVAEAYVVLAAGWEPNALPRRHLALLSRAHAAYSRIRLLEFAELPKTISGKIRRVELRQREQHLHGGQDVTSVEFREEGFSNLKQ